MKKALELAKKAYDIEIDELELKEDKDFNPCEIINNFYFENISDETLQAMARETSTDIFYRHLSHDAQKATL